MRVLKVVGYSVLLLPFLLAAGGRAAQPGTMAATDLMTEFRKDPVGVATGSPEFGWTLEASFAGARNLRQSAYRIRLATSRAGLEGKSGTIWDSGRVASPTYWQRAYQGPPLQSHTTYFWQVRVWSDGGAAGPWSRTGQFTTALLADSDWTARWIAAEPDRAPSKQALEEQGALRAVQPPPLPVFRKEFRLSKPVASALLFVSGLGQYEVHLNGSDVTDTVLNSGWADYRKTAPYNTYDVTKLVRPAGNAFGVLLGNGMYNVEGVKGHYTKFVGSFGQPKCLLQLEVRYTDGSAGRFITDGSWQTHAGPVLYSSTFGGEEFDGGALPVGWDKAGFEAGGWRPALEVAGPGGRPAAEQAPPMIVARTYQPVQTTTPRAGVTVFDLGENMSGWPSMTVSGPAGSKVTLLAGEMLNPDGTVTQRSAAATPEEPVLFSYRLRGGGPESWHPRFAYYSFRYVQVTTEPAPGAKAEPKVLSLAGEFVHDRAPEIGTFASSNALFQRIHTLIDRAVLSNLASVVTDCPSREKLGWLEQTYLNAATLMLNYDVTGLYEKMSDDMRDAQLPDGLVPSIAPEFVAFVDGQGKSTAFRDSPEWGSAMILSPWALFQYTGDMRPLVKNYAGMQRYAAYLKSRAANGLLDYGLGDWYDIGPKEPGPSQLTSRLVTATGVYYEDLVTMARVATLLGKAEDAAMYTREAAAVREAYNAKLFHAGMDQYDRGSQTANAVPLALGLVPAEHVQAVLDHLVADIHAHDDHVTAGDVGFHYVVRALTDHGRSDVLAAMFSRTDSPSYGYQLSRGATTLTEAWDANPKSSQNHFMLGHGEEWFYRGLAGLSVDMARGAADAIQVQPSFLEGVASASATYRAPMGGVAMAWSRVGGGAVVELTVPVGAQAHLKFPGASGWREGGASAGQTPGVLAAKTDAGTLALTLGSGTYHFTLAELPSAATSHAVP